MKNEYTEDFWKQLIEKYFEASTTLEEEKLLEQFLASKQGQAQEYDEIRAVMGYFVTAKQTYKKAPSVLKRTLKPYYRVATIAACMILVWVGTDLAYTRCYLSSEPAEMCIAYVDGVSITDQQYVIQMMEEQMRSITHHQSEEEEMKKQLNDMFQPLNQ